MLLHCESEHDTPLDGAPWLRAETLESLAELNEYCLALCAEEARVRGAQAAPFLKLVAEAWRVLDPPARHRAAACPYLLLDAGFAEPARWRPAAQQVGDGSRSSYTSYFTVPAAGEVARLVFTYAWHLARSQSHTARLVLGIPPASAALIAQYTLRQIQQLAETHLEWLKPRWPMRVQVWRELLCAAAAGETAALERIRLHGFALLAGETRPAGPERT